MFWNPKCPLLALRVLKQKKHFLMTTSPQIGELHIFCVFTTFGRVLSQFLDLAHVALFLPFFLPIGGKTKSAKRYPKECSNQKVEGNKSALELEGIYRVLGHISTSPIDHGCWKPPNTTKTFQAFRYFGWLTLAPLLVLHFLLCCTAFQMGEEEKYDFQNGWTLFDFMDATSDGCNLGYLKRHAWLARHTTERKSTPLTRIGTMLLACLGLYPQVGSDLEMITILFLESVAKYLYIFLF